jgi:hypothetical protein
LENGETPTQASGTVALHERWEKAVGERGFYRIMEGFSRMATGCYRINAAGNRLLPHITASYRIKFFSRAMGRIRRMGRMSEVLSPLRVQNAVARIYAEKGSDCFTKVRESSRSFTKVRTDQGRGYAMLRIVTGEALFYER